MKTFLCLCLVLIDVVLSYPHHGDYSRSPQRTVMFGGYYGHPMDTRSYVPQGSMSFASGDTIATNSFAGERPELQTSAEEITEKRKNTFEEAEEQETSTKAKGILKPKPSKDDDDNDNDDQDASSFWPFMSGRNGAPSYNAFFPVMIGGMSGSRKSGNGDGLYPGSATAIANSFSTGRGGVATSHATSFGYPYLNPSFFKNGSFNRKAPKSGHGDD